MFKFSFFLSVINQHDNSVKHRLLHGAFWSMFGSIISKAINLLSFIILARVITQESYGELGIIRSTLNMFAVATGMGMGYTATKYIAQYRNINPSFAGNIYALSNSLSIIIGIIGTVCLLLLSNTIAKTSLDAPHLSTAIKLGAIVLFFTTINGIQSGALNGFEAFKKSAINQIIAGIIQGILIVLLGFYYGVNGCVIALGIGCIILGILNKISILGELNNSNISCDIKNIDKSTISVLWKFAIPTLLSSLMVTPVLWLSRTILINESGYEQMAIFDVADQWSMSVIFIPNALAQIALPILSNTLYSGESNKYIGLVKLNLIANFIVASIVSAVVIILSPYILKMYGPEYSNKMPLIFMMIATVCMSICNVVGQVIASQGKMWIGFVFNVVWALFLIFFTNIFAKYGAVGLSLAITCSYFIHFIGQVLYLIVKFYKNEKNHASLWHKTRSNKDVPTR